MVENVSVERSLIGGVVEDLQELRSSEMEHELWVKSKVLFKAEGAGVIFAVLGEA